MKIKCLFSDSDTHNQTNGKRFVWLGSYAWVHMGSYAWVPMPGLLWVHMVSYSSVSYGLLWIPMGSYGFLCLGSHSPFPIPIFPYTHTCVLFKSCLESSASEPLYVFYISNRVPVLFDVCRSKQNHG